jgi:ATP-dependent RNA helicase DHX37/DHR1
MMMSAKKKAKSPASGGGGGGVAGNQKYGGPRPGGRGAAPPAPTEKKLSKSQRRKLAKVEDDKRKREARAGVVARLNAAKLVSDESLVLLQGSDRMGQRMTAREKLRRELRAERAGISLPGIEDSRLTKREKPEGADGSDDSSSEGESDEDGDRTTDKPKASWPSMGAVAAREQTGATGKKPYGPLHPMDPDYVDDAAAIAAAEAAIADGDGGGDNYADDEDDAAARDKTRVAMASARQLAELIRSRDPEQAAFAATEAQGPAAAAAAVDPKDAAAQLAAANEAAAAAAAKRFPGVFCGASFSVSVARAAAIQECREGLPILGAEHDIVDAINTNPITVICGETGCGKTTQVPQFLYEAGYGDPACVAHPGAVAVTQPRRVAVTSTATRVAQELNLPLGGDVGYQVRYDKKVGVSPRIKFMTDGILLREIQADLLLRKYSVIIVDEAHERSVNTDILLGLLSRVVPLRAELAMEGRAGITPLRLVVMSATLRVEEFVGNARLCPTPPALLKVAARQFPVTIHFSRVTEHGDYLGAVKKKVMAIHRKLPPGGVLIFLTGVREVDALCKKLRGAYPAPAPPRATNDYQEEEEEEERIQGGRRGGKVGRAGKKGRREGGKGKWGDAVMTEATTATGDDAEAGAADEDDDEDGVPGLDAYDVDGVDGGGEDFGGEDVAGDDVEGDALRFGGRDDFDDASDHDDSASDISEEDEVEVHGGEGVDAEAAAEAEAAWVRAHVPTTAAAAKSGAAEDAGPGYMHVLPLYALLPTHLQRRVFEPPPPGSRLVVVATNVAETSLTIPGVRYVVDAGREKRRVYGDEATGGGGGGAASAGLSRFTVGWVSKASAEQRAGRAGRTGPGHCYRLFSSAHFVNDLQPHAPPAILSVPVEGVVLQMRAMGIDRVMRFPFISPPDPISLATAQKTLTILGALAPSRGAGSAEDRSNSGQWGHGGAMGDGDDVGVLTATGRAMAALPISPRHSRMLLAAAESPVRGCLAAAVATAAALSVDSPFLRGESGERDTAAAEMTAEEKQRRRKLAHRFHHPHSDALSSARALVAYDGVRDPRLAEIFCAEHRLHGRTMREMSDLRRQLLRILADPPPCVAAGAATLNPKP